MAGKRGKKHKGGHDDGHVDERWLLTYADLITLLMALFMVLWSISSVNISKFESLQRSLAEAFNGRPVLGGGEGIRENGGSTQIQSPAPSLPLAVIQRVNPSQNPRESGPEKKMRQQQEQEQLKKTKQKVDQAAKELGLQNRLKTSLDKDGLHIRVMSDDLLFDSGSADLKPKSGPLIKKLGQTLLVTQHPLFVTGHTDDVPISGRYRSNVNLSGDRASNVVNGLRAAGMPGTLMTAAGRGEWSPIASNGSDSGRQMNRRVEILVPREFGPDATDSITTGARPNIKNPIVPKP